MTQQKIPDALEKVPEILASLFTQNISWDSGKEFEKIFVMAGAFRVLTQTHIAICFAVSDEEQMWMPKSQIDRRTRFVERDGQWWAESLIIPQWAAQKRGLMPVSTSEAERKALFAEEYKEFSRWVIQQKILKFTDMPVDNPDNARTWTQEQEEDRQRLKKREP